MKEAECAASLEAGTPGMHEEHQFACLTEVSGRKKLACLTKVKLGGFSKPDAIQQSI